MVVQVDWPQVQVLLRKTTGVNFSTGVADQYRGASGAIDWIGLTPFLGDAGSVRTRKALDEPCGGFSITFADRFSQTGGDTVYALAEPMDQIEIRMARVPVGIGGTPPLVMRGYISSVRRVETIAADGTPQRVVVIQGQDSGKLWQNHSILPEAQMAAGMNTMLSTYALFAATGITFGILPVNDFVTTFVQQVMNPAVALMAAFSGVAIPNFTAVCSVPPEEGWISASILQGFPGGKYWDVLEYVADRPWNELFVRDRPDGGPPELVFRPVPYLNVDGGLIMDGAEMPRIIDRDIGDIVSLDASRSDYRTANFFYVPPNSSIPDSAGGVNIEALTRLGSGDEGPMFSISHNNSALALYGLRKMQHETRLMAHDLPSPRSANLNPPGDRPVAITNTTAWHLRRAQKLKDLNLDNVVWETVQMVVKGHEDFEVGTYVRWTRGQFRGTGMTFMAYCTAVEHSFTPLKTGGSAAWTTTLTLERGDGFLNRDTQAGYPYWIEGRRGPYSPGG